MVIPALFVDILLAASLGGGTTLVAIAIFLRPWSSFAQISRADMIALKNHKFVTLARPVDSPYLRIIVVHVLPSIFCTAIVQIGTNLGGLMFPG